MDREGIPHSPDGESPSPDQIPKNQRSLKSLHMLATRFVGLLQEAENGLLDLKDAVRLLAVGKKRRIYDITNVLEGVGLIVKISKSMVKWNGAVLGEHAFRLTNRVIELRAELKDLEQKESDTLLAVQAPRGTQLDVPIPKAVQNCPAKYQIYLKSINGPIDVVLLNKLTVDSVPVVLPVPPSKELLRNAKSAMSTSDETESSIKHAAKSRRMIMEDMLHLQSSSRSNTEPNPTDASELRDLSKELQDLLRPTKAIMNAEQLKNLLASEGFSPLRRSSIPSEQEYIHTRDESEGLSDIAMHNV